MRKKLGASKSVNKLRGDGIMARAARGSAFVLFGHAGSQIMRLISNLILTRLLFPEAFGLMAIISVVEMGLLLFTDLGISPSISQSKRGDDPDFLDTAFTLQAIRSLILWLLACALAYPASVFYDAPELVYYLPISSLTLVIMGIWPTRLETAYRHMQLGKATMIELASQLISAVIIIIVAWITGSVFALVIGGLTRAVAKLILAHFMLEGHRNRFRLERTAVHELIHFGKWIFASTFFNFFSTQGDRLLFGKFLSLATLGIYNVGFYLGSVPLLLGRAVTSRMMIPIYREVEAEGSESSARRLSQMRFLITAGLVGSMLVLAYAGVALVDLLYDPRYQNAGAMLVLIALAMAPEAIGLTYAQAALARGDSRSFFWVSAARGVFGIGFLFLGLKFYGIAGALVGMGIGKVLVHPVIIWLSVKHRVWDPRHDALFFTLWLVLGAGAIWLHFDSIRALGAMAN